MISASLTFKKSLFRGVAFWAIASFFAFGVQSMCQSGHSTEAFFYKRLFIQSLLITLIFPFFYLWLYWAQRLQESKSMWHRWWAKLLFVAYLSGALMVGGIKCWDVILPVPWNRWAQLILFVLLLTSWFFPLLFSARHSGILNLSKKTGNFLILLGGISGAYYGMSAVRTGNQSGILIILGILLPFMALNLAQSNFVQIWLDCPCWKEGKT